MNPNDTQLPNQQTNTPPAGAVPPFPQTGAQPSPFVPPVQNQTQSNPAVSPFPPQSPAQSTPSLNLTGSMSSPAVAPLSTPPSMPSPQPPGSTVSTPQQTTTPPLPAGPQTFKPDHEGKSKLPLVIAGILLLLAIAGGYFLYTLYQMPTESMMDENSVPVVTQAPSPTLTEEEQTLKEIEMLNDVSTSDELDAIEADVNNTNLTDIDKNL